MASFVFNSGLGRSVQLADQGSAFVVVLLQAAEADSVLRDYDDLETLLAQAGNTELVDASYARKTGLTGTITLDDTNDDQTVSLADQTFVGLDGSAVVKALVCYSLGAGDANIVPLVASDISVDPDGSNITVRMP